MKIWRFHQFGPIKNLQIEDVPDPEPGPGEALVRVAYAALNPADRYLVSGKYPRPGKPPFAVGRDGSGIIEKVGAGSRFKPGDAVVLLRSEIGVQRDGTLAELVVVPEVSLAPLPAGWSMEEGAAGPLVLLTAWQALMTEGQLQPGQTVLVTGASGGVGTAALMLAKSHGARVVALSRSDRKRARLLELGADFAFDPDDPDLVKVVQAALGGGRCDVVVENLGGPYLQKSIYLTGFKGRICVVACWPDSRAKSKSVHSFSNASASSASRWAPKRRPNRRKPGRTSSPCFRNPGAGHPSTGSFRSARSRKPSRAWPRARWARFSSVRCTADIQSKRPVQCRTGRSFASRHPHPGMTADNTLRSLIVVLFLAVELLDVLLEHSDFGLVDHGQLLGNAFNSA